MAEQFEVSGIIPATPAQIYAAWLHGEQHAAMTGGAAEAEPVVGAPYSAWNGYVIGKNLELDPDRRIVQSWRTTKFPPDAPDSRLEVMLEPADGGTRITIVHSDVPDGQAASYENGWHEHYLEPMAKHFGGAPKKAAAPKAAKPAAKQGAAALQRKPTKAAAKASKGAAKKASKKGAKKPAKLAAKASKKPAKKSAKKAKPAKRRAKR